MESKDYRAYLVECVKATGQMIIDMAEDIVGETDMMSNLSISAEFDQEFNRSIPELTITRSHMPDRETLERLLDIRFEKLIKENNDEKK